jgi:hypothetical protein
MYARVVRFTDVTKEAIDGILARIETEGGPPEGVDSTGVKLLYDAQQGTALFVGYFENAEKMAAADAVLDAMDPSETPGTRASVDQCEVIVERDS